ncbi:matrixin family metalloprotease [Chengkuizengella marina]|nr:matrixin family metalloprotease [Chengkuizengella marina]
MKSIVDYDCAPTPIDWSWKLENNEVYYDNNCTDYKDHWNEAALAWTYSGSPVNLTLVDSDAAVISVNEVDEVDVTWDGITYPVPSSQKKICILNKNPIERNADVYDYETIVGVATHELGHALGLDHHEDNNCSVMYGATSGREKTTPQDADKNAIKSLYNYDSIDGKSYIVMHASWSRKYSIDRPKELRNLYDDADLVICGEVIEEHGSTPPDNIEDFHAYFTRSKIQIGDILKDLDNNAKGDNILVHQMGGQSCEHFVKHAETTHLRSGEKALIFLKKSKDGSFYYPINEDHSIFMFHKEDELVHLKTKKYFSFMYFLVNFIFNCNNDTRERSTINCNNYSREQIKRKI